MFLHSFAAVTLFPSLLTKLGGSISPVKLIKSLIEVGKEHIEEKPSAYGMGPIKCLYGISLTGYHFLNTYLWADAQNRVK